MYFRSAGSHRRRWVGQLTLRRTVLLDVEDVDGQLHAWRHHADLEAQCLVLLDVEDVDGQLEARSFVVDVHHVDRQLGRTYTCSQTHAAC